MDNKWNKEENPDETTHLSKRREKPKMERINKEICKMIRASKMDYVDNIIERGRVGDAAYFWLVKKLNSKESPSPWNVGHLFPDLSDIDVANIIIKYFGNVSDLLPPLNWEDRPTMGGDEGMDELS